MIHKVTVVLALGEFHHSDGYFNSTLIVVLDSLLIFVKKIMGDHKGYYVYRGFLDADL